MNYVTTVDQDDAVDTLKTLYVRLGSCEVGLAPKSDA